MNTPESTQNLAPEATTETHTPEAELLAPEATEGQETEIISEQAAEEMVPKADLLRMAAEMANLKKRTVKEVSDARDFALKGFARELLAVADGLDLALRNAGDDELSKGVQLVQNQLAKTFQQFGIVAVQSVGEQANPELHEAIQTQEVPDTEAGVITQEMQKGYTLNGRLLRPALVVVAG